MVTETTESKTTDKGRGAVGGCVGKIFTASLCFAFAHTCRDEPGCQEIFCPVGVECF